MDAVNIIKPSYLTRPILVSLPHSGLYIPPSCRMLFHDNHLRTLKNTDWYLNELYAFLKNLDVYIVSANFSRYVIDPNRALQKDNFGPYQSHAVYHKNTWGEDIYKKNPTPDDIQNRIINYYNIYHNAIKAGVKDLFRHHPKIYLFDLHSFGGLVEEDVCIGNCNRPVEPSSAFCVTCDVFEKYNYAVAKNKIFKGGYITSEYGQWDNVEAVQIELNYKTYLQKQQVDRQAIPKIEPIKFKQAQERLEKIVTDIFSDIA